MSPGAATSGTIVLSRPVGRRHCALMKCFDFLYDAALNQIKLLHKDKIELSSKKRSWFLLFDHLLPLLYFF